MKVEDIAVAGNTIEAAIQAAMAMARPNGESIEFDFNGIEQLVTPEDTLETALARWRERLDAEIEAQRLHRLTPEYQAEQEERRKEAQRRYDETLVAALEAARTNTEEQFREGKAPWLRQSHELQSYIDTLVSRGHDYGSAAYAMSFAAAAAFNYVAHAVGATGFQASCADLDFLRHTRSFEFGRVQDYGNLLYPQYLKEEDFSLEGIFEKYKDRFKELAQKKLDEEDNLDLIAPRVRRHWEMLAAGINPAVKVPRRYVEVVRGDSGGLFYHAMEGDMILSVQPSFESAEASLR